MLILKVIKVVEETDFRGTEKTLHVILANRSGTSVPATNVGSVLGFGAGGVLKVNAKEFSALTDNPQVGDEFTMIK